MAVTGLDIYKLLPQTNCGDCGVPTCLAFAMKVAAKQSSLEECPHVSDEAQEELGAASAPPQKLVKMGAGERAIEIGNETVMFRHDEKFHHPCGIGVLVNDTDDVDAKAERIEKLSFERIGQVIEVDVVAARCASGDGAKLKEAARALNDRLGLPVVLIGESADQLRPAAEALADARPLLWEREGPSEELIGLAAETGLPLVVEGDLEKCDADTQKAREAGVEGMVLCPGMTDPQKALEFLTITRRAAVNKTYRPLGYPALVYARSQDPVQLALEAAHYVLKYAGIVLMDVDTPEYVLPVLVARQSIYIDPQRPVQVEPKIYEVNEPDAESPLLITTNFSLSYYSVLSEVEASRVPSRILTVDTQGTSVLTAWAADEFGPEQIKEAIEKSGVFDELADGHCRPVIPGLVAVISGELSEELGQKVIVGPKEASGIPRFLKNEWPSLVG
ncbi:MAG: acetyl-CoA decarbonylase/synthase complex subunit gamma [Candidatus Brocadiaceae bacterium]|jgi:acetyl-CoA decarbonylase/synthase complex subunit gamma